MLSMTHAASNQNFGKFNSDSLQSVLYHISTSIQLKVVLRSLNQRSL